MLSHLRNYFKSNKQDIFIIAIIILIALIFFGLGRLTVPDKEPVLIKGLESSSR